MRMDKKAVLPIAGATMAAGAAIGMMMMPKKKKPDGGGPGQHGRGLGRVALHRLA